MILFDINLIGRRIKINDREIEDIKRIKSNESQGYVYLPLYFNIKNLKIKLMPPTKIEKKLTNSLFFTSKHKSY